jgi:hypothetical protein
MFIKVLYDNMYYMTWKGIQPAMATQVTCKYKRQLRFHRRMFRGLKLSLKMVTLPKKYCLNTQTDLFEPRISHHEDNEPNKIENCVRTKIKTMSRL